jgi:hypothetical protein
VPEHVFPRLWKDFPGLDEWIWKHMLGSDFTFGAFAFEVQVRAHSFTNGATLEFGYYLAYKTWPEAEPEVYGGRSLTRCPGRELLIQGHSLSEPIHPEDLSMFEFRVSQEMLSAIVAEHNRALEPTPA